MSYIPVIDSTVLSRRDIAAKDGRTLHLLELTYPDFCYEPGQFVMVQLQNHGFQWSYPYMVYKKTEKGLQVLSSPHSSLYRCAQGDKIAIWGANGKGCTPAPSSFFVTEAATFHLIAPLAAACEVAHLIFIGTDEAAPLDLTPSDTIYVPEPSAVSELLPDTGAGIFMALNLPVLEKVMENTKPELKKQISIFVSTRIGCGIGACRSCYLHSPDIHTGIPVCCNGPYLPYCEIDFEKDKKCFQTFR
ncbi:MAG: hypothetical protein Q4C91_22470 [Eubacteriales bacterium]|nr:hypothetical protein [Eubacteriales bacterium]